jgi:hypothetical protein
MKRGNNPKITALEEISATAAAVQNILLSATANEGGELLEFRRINLSPCPQKLL